MFKVEETWAKVINSEDQIPKAFQDAFHEFTAGTDAFPYAVFVPSDKVYRKNFPMKLLCLTDEYLYIFAQKGKNVSVDRFLLEEISSIERGTVLLYSWVTFDGLIDGKRHIVTVEFNSVGVTLFTQMIEEIRRKIGEIEFTGGQLERLREEGKFNCLNERNYKFMNFGKDALLPGETVSNIVLQPAIKKRCLMALHKTVSPAHLMIVTDKELILITDDESNNARNHTYGGIWRFIPLRKISRLSVEEDLALDNLVLCVDLVCGEKVSSVFSKSFFTELESLTASLASVKG